MKKTTIILAWSMMLLSVILLSIYSYMFIYKLLNRGVMVAVHTDVFFSQWVFLAILGYSCVLILKGKVNANLFLQVAILGLILDFICYKVIFNLYFFYSYFRIIIYISLLVFFNLNKLLKENNWERVNFKQTVFILVFDIAIITASSLYLKCLR